MIEVVIRRHGFTDRFILAVQSTLNHGVDAGNIIQNSLLLRYIHDKMKAAERGSKARKSFGNIYAIFVVVEDYRHKVPLPDSQLRIVDYHAAQFSDLFARQRELFGGAKLQNHALNARCNMEFLKKMSADKGPILRNQNNQDYWVNQSLLLVEVGGIKVNISSSIIAVVEEYISALKEEFSGFIDLIEQIILLGDRQASQNLILQNLGDSSDSRLFEITAFAIIHCYLSQRTTFIGDSRENLVEVPWTLYKTGRTNANDGGIDFVLTPYGRFFQVTEEVDVVKWFLDIDKIARYPITFVVKDSRSSEGILLAIRSAATERLDPADVSTMMDCIEEVINVPTLIQMFEKSVENGNLEDVMSEILRHSKVEFNLED